MLSNFDLTICADSVNDNRNCGKVVQDGHLQGRRIVDIKKMFPEISNIKHEHTNCTFADLKFIREYQNGHVRKYILECKTCH